jgi:aryl-alcohol dehydrogenase-like predicted oxidoreductase
MEGQLMLERNLGTSGLRVSAVGMGCNNFGGRIDTAASARVIDRAIDHGITLFDTADVYSERGGSETAMGEILTAPKRQRIVLATKCGMPMDEEGRLKGASRRYIMSAVEGSLKRLKTDWIDLYQIHQVDPLTPIEETLRALDDLVRAGKVRYIGLSNHPAWMVVEAQETARRLGLNAFISCQDEMSLLIRDADRELMPMMSRYGLGLLPYFPLACGLLTGKYSRGAMPQGARLSYMKRYADKYINDRNWRVIDELTAFAKARGHTLLDLAFSWLLARPSIASVIAGATSDAQVDANVKAASWRLSPEDMAEIDRITA